MEFAPHLAPGEGSQRLGRTCARRHRALSDPQLVKRYGPIDLALVPIGGHYTMDRHDAVTAVEWIGASAVIPCHYDTITEIETDAHAFADDVHAAGTAKGHLLAPGDSVTL